MNTTSPRESHPIDPTVGHDRQARESFKLSPPLSEFRGPLVVSCPHAGTEIPQVLQGSMDTLILKTLPDTDWYVDQLYAFAPALGAYTLAARWSRYVIDLNRDPDDRPLYQDGRPETGLIPTHSFAGSPLVTDAGLALKSLSREERLQSYYQPYHDKIKFLIGQLRQDHPHVLLWEAHSIKRRAGKNQKQPFVDIMIGDRDGTSCHPALTAAAVKSLSKQYKTVLNTPFKGGYLTQHFANPKAGIHALQIEMCQDLYLDDQNSEDLGFPRLSAKAPQLSAALKDAMIDVMNLLTTQSMT